jgi:hypothetical protein
MTKRHTLILSSLTVLGLVVVAASCRTPDGSFLRDDRVEERPLKAGPEAAMAMPTDPETQAAIRALNLIGAAIPFAPEGVEPRCASACHAGQGGGNWHVTIDKEKVKKWGKQMQDLEACFKANTSNRKKVNCMRANPADANSAYDQNKLGFYRAGVRTEQFQVMFRKAFGNVTGPQKHAEFADVMIMPQKLSTNQMSEEEFKVLKDWVLGGMKKLDDAFGGDTSTGEDICVDEVDPELIENIERMRSEGWGWKNVNNEQVSMFGCPEVDGEYEELSTPLSCFQDDDKWPQAHQREYAKGWAERFTPTGSQLTQRIRILKELPFRSTYWARSSADGRFSGSGLRFGDGHGALPPGAQSSGYIVDLKDQSRPVIGVSGPYDPGFFPDNKGFTFMTGGDGAYFCNQALLEDPATTSIDFANETTFCGRSDMGVYQHVGAMLGGGDYFVVRSDNYANDDGGNSGSSEFSDPSTSPFARDESKVSIYPMQESGTRFKVMPKVEITLPYEGDFGIFPSARYITSRVGVKNGSSYSQNGYRIRSFDTATKTTKQLANICMSGGKVTVSFNERIVATHHYTDLSDAKNFRMEPTDPKFKALVHKSANVWLYDLATKQKIRITAMKSGQYALYPHWRADGWLYFIVRDTNTSKDYLVASDAGIRMQK